jgi:hypothetical protein
MTILATATVGALLLAALLIAIFKGSRPPQPIPSNPTAPKRAALAVFVPVVCIAIQYATFKSVALYRVAYLEQPKPLIILLVGVIAPWLAGIYFAYMAARAANKVLRAIGAVEVLTFLLTAGMALLSR